MQSETQILALLAVALLLGKGLSGWLEQRKIPGVLGELLTGVALGNLGGRLGFSFSSLESSESIRMLSELGILFLLFIVGLETDFKQIKKNGADALLAACAGVVGPVVLGLIFLPLVASMRFGHALFLAAALSATSVGVTARVLRDQGQAASPSGQLILGAAVADDILGIVLLALVSASASNAPLSLGVCALMLFKIILFGCAIVLFQRFGAKRLLGKFRPLEISGTVTVLLLCGCFIAAWAAEAVGLAGIVGAFAFGIALDQVHFRGYREAENIRLDQVLKPISDFLVPIFFIVMGMSVKLKFLADPSALSIGLVLTLCGILGKLACGWAIRKRAVRRGADRWLVGLGMIPRGEVGLIFAAVGMQTGVLRPSDYAAVVLMVALTTLAAPFAIAWRVRSLGVAVHQR